MEEVVVYDSQSPIRGESQRAPLFMRFAIPFVVTWGILGVFVPVWMKEAHYAAVEAADTFQAVFPKGLLSKLWQRKQLPVWVQGYALEIPKLSIQEPIVQDVNISDKSDYMSALTHGVAHASGSSSPGQTGVQYYFAHSSGLPFWGSRAVTFATLNKLKQGDEIAVYKDDQKFTYLVSEKKIVSPEDVELLTSVGGSERVVLQTCWPIGTDWKRLLVVAERDVPRGVHPSP